MRMRRATVRLKPPEVWAGWGWVWLCSAEVKPSMLLGGTHGFLSRALRRVGPRQARYCAHLRLRTAAMSLRCRGLARLIAGSKPSHSSPPSSAGYVDLLRVPPRPNPWSLVCRNLQGGSQLLAARLAVLQTSDLIAHTRPIVAPLPKRSFAFNTRTLLPKASNPDGHASPDLAVPRQAPAALAFTEN